MMDWGTLAVSASRENDAATSHNTSEDEEMSSVLSIESTLLPDDDGRSARVQGWRLALWQPWRERRMKPSKPQHQGPSRRPPTLVATYNINGYWSKEVEIGELLGEEQLAVLAIQETLVSVRHYPIQMNGYRAYASNVKENFCRIAMLVTNMLASYEVPHELHWLIHVKIFNYAGLSGPTHFINVYLKSGGNHCRTRKEQLQVVKRIVAKILERDRDSRVVVMGDLNEPKKQLLHHLNIVGSSKNYLFPAHFVGSRRTHFPLRGEPLGIDHILLTETSQKLFQGARVLRDYNSSDHHPVVVSPYADLVSAVQKERPTRAAFDSKMICLKGDLLVNDNVWTRLMHKAYGEEPEPLEDEPNAEVSAFATKFIDTFDKMCHKHKVKKVHMPGSKPEFPKKLKLLQQTVLKYSKSYHKAIDCNQTPDKSTCIWLARAQTHFKKAKKSWQVRVRQQFYACVADDFVANNNKNVWSRL